MRKALLRVAGTLGKNAHAGLVYERYAPEKAHDGPQDLWGKWLSRLEEHPEPEDYAEAFKRWEDALRQSYTASFTARAASRLLVGHGNASPTEVGLTLHHTWGVPVVPGSSLKGVLAGYLRAVYGDGAKEERRRLFGVPGEDGAPEQAHRGEVIFHDAQWVPLARGNGEAGTRSFLARDVLTVHHSAWYGGKPDWPNDYEPPNPVAFLSVRPGGRFLVALSLAPGTEADPQAEDFLAWTARRLDEALRHWGVGGKTAAGYGRLEREGPYAIQRPRRPVRASPALTEFLAWVEARRTDKLEQKQVLSVFELDWLPRLVSLSPEAREAGARALRTLVKSPKLEARRDALLARIGTGG
ncbi:type III-B CRISPR module RAMP protein Cmr6 [Corallococcus macrosporus]|uniref:CRISPR-associated RAMP Cmr6 family protein n=1 Tax=Myxococcus fulvus (strain ATCC BAA-855 / HW-1) TaxID=483219 RepID=F8CL02_MYXFH|nr:type III-B CRISPR module RAMP protein Cmr6 [Corallococcus macrosporus]AEI63915.1 CRISPR-associated RAMP Cmr6 family protein [Corallococcus macrosporus]